MEQNDKQEIVLAINQLSTKIDSEVGKLSNKIDSEVGKLSNKIDSEVGKLSNKIDDEIGSVTEQISALADHVEERFNQVDKRFEQVDDQFGGLKSYIDTRLAQTETRVVTKDYLDNKLADLNGDLNILMRKEDTKLVALVQVLRDRKIIQEEDAKRIFSMELYPQISI